MLDFVIGAVVGAGAIVAKDVLKDKSSAKSNQGEMTTLYNENERLRQQNKELKRLMEDCNDEIAKLKRNSKRVGSEQEDLEDELEDAKSLINKLKKQNEFLTQEIKEYKRALDEYKSTK